MKKFLFWSFGLCFGFVLLMLVVGVIVGPQPRRADASPKKVEPQGPKLDSHDLAMHSTEIVKYHGHKDESGMVLYETFTIANVGNAVVKDVKVRCDHSAASGTVIDSNTRTIYEIIPAHKTRTFRDFNMGLIDPQVKASSCQIEDLAVVGEAP